VTRARVLVAAVVVTALAVVTGAVALASSLSVASKHLGVFRTCALGASTAASTSLIDSYVDQSRATTNNNSLNALVVAAQNNANQRAYLKFDLTKCSPVMPASATVRSATLRLYAAALPTACRAHDLFTVTSAWSETTITWSNQPFGTTLNNPSTAARSSSLNIGTAAGCQNSTTGFVTGWDVTSDVQSFVGGATNNGWMIRDSAELTAAGTAMTAQYRSKVAGSAPLTPQLLVTYST
jgi:hypothetical protein